MRRARRLALAEETNLRHRDAHRSARAHTRDPSAQRLLAGQHSKSDLSSLQRTIGNAAIQRVLAAKQSDLLQRGDDGTPEAESGNAWFEAPAMQAMLATFVNMMTLVKDQKAAEALVDAEAMALQLKQAQETAEALKQKAQQEAAEHLISAVAAGVSGAISVAAFAGGARSPQMEKLSEGIDGLASHFDSTVQKVIEGAFLVAKGEAEGQAALVDAARSVVEQQIAKTEGAAADAEAYVLGSLEDLQKLVDGALKATSLGRA